MATYADDLSPGHRFTFGRHPVHEDEILAFARQWDPIVIHTDPDAARERGLPGVIASGLHTLGIYQRFIVEALWSDAAGGVGRSFEIRFRRPVHPGTTLTGHATVRTVTPRPERGDALVVIDGELRDDDGQVVLAIVGDAVLPLRPAA
ncbi:MaoC/PaaZ C-terminal domain-containing protein [Patulibacter minatonensis]|uniref:MaoC/PaaZ C-terminal domain-containing protein n=1 Tax=Patulibacter minatonensis TaxID=298163 RepID=UPI0004B5EA8C|nr:MaoC/PaaZ C-terminal domain-containing protein [Patulibacter minatonensis]